MLFAKTFCKNTPGSYVMVVPVGLLATVQYSQNGLLEKIYTGYGEDKKEVSLAQFRGLSKHVPNSVPLSGGTTFVEGVFYSTSISIVSGNLPECTYEDYLSRAESSSNDFSFYAGRVSSLAASFAGALNIRNWLNIAKFKVLPGIVVPNDITEDTIMMLMKNSVTADFKYPYIAGFMLYNNTSFRYSAAELKQLVVKTVSKSLNESGYVLSTVNGDSDKITINYSTLVANDIQTGTSVLYCNSENTTVLATRKVDNRQRERLSNVYVCPSCGKKLAVPADGPFCCDDINCLSRSYPAVVRLLSTLKLDVISYADYLKAIKNNEILTYTDVLLLKPYKDASITCTLADAIKAATPVEICANDEFFYQLATACNSSVETLMYYLQNPLRAATDLEINNTIYGQRFMQWAQESCNILTIQTVLNCVDLRREKASYDFGPIFRGRKFMLTGRFIQGSFTQMCELIESTSATVVTDLSKDVPDFVVTGGTYENIDGKIVKFATDHGIPVYDEYKFMDLLNYM